MTSNNRSARKCQNSSPSLFSDSNRVGKLKSLGADTTDVNNEFPPSKGSTYPPNSPSGCDEPNAGPPLHPLIREFLDGEGKTSPAAEARAFFTLVTFFTRLSGPTYEDHPGYLMRGMTYFPLVGTIVGVFAAFFYDFAEKCLCLPAMVAAIASTAASLWLTAYIHEDGLANASDGIGGGSTRQQILTIMGEGRLGTVGCANLLLYMVTKWQLLASTGTSRWSWVNCRGAGPAILTANVIARCTTPYLIRTRDYVDETGPTYKYSSFVVHAKHLVTNERVLFALLTAVCVAVFHYGVIVALVLITATLIFAHVAGAYAEDLLGGVMGDYLSAIICLAELLVLAMLFWASKIQWDGFHDFVVRPLSLLKEKLIQILGKVIQLCVVTCRFLLGMAAIVVVCSTISIAVSKMSTKTDTVKQQSTNQSPKQETKQRLVRQHKRNESEPASASPSTNTTIKDSPRTAMADPNSFSEPMGSMGNLQDRTALLTSLCKAMPSAKMSAVCLVFAGDHGVATTISDGSTTSPRESTNGILDSWNRQVAAASVSSNQNDVQIRVVDVGVAERTVVQETGTVRAHPQKLRGGTRNFCTQPAMTVLEANRCIQIGREEFWKCCTKDKFDVVALGEISVGSMVSSVALVSAFTGADPKNVFRLEATARAADAPLNAAKVGSVVGALKCHNEIIEGFRVKLKKNSDVRSAAIEVLAALGGSEIAALVGAILEASDREQQSSVDPSRTCVPIIVDGLLVTTAAMVAAYLQPKACRVMFISTKSEESGQLKAIEAIRNVAKRNGILEPENPAIGAHLQSAEGAGSNLVLPILRSSRKLKWPRLRKV